MPNRYIVRLRSPLNELQDKASVLATFADGVRGRAWGIINGFEIGSLSDDALARLKAHPSVESVNPDVPQVVVASQGLTGNPYLWGLDRVDQRTGPPYDGTFNYFFSGTGVRVYIVDSGIYPHPDFGGRLAPGYSALYEYPYTDVWGHGTLVASVAAGSVTGVAKEATLVSVKVVRVDSSGPEPIGLADPSDTVDGLNWILNWNSPPGVVNYSISPKKGDSFNGDIILALNNLANVGYLVAVAAGNWDQDACIQGRNQFLPWVLVVSASTSANARAPLVGGAANYGPCVDLFAPGADVATVFSPRSFQQYDRSWGTSVATPFVAGVAASILQQRPGAPNWEVPYLITNTTTDGALTSATLGAGSPNKLLNSLHRWVWIDGPVFVSSTSTTQVTWSAVPIGGNGSWSYQWEASVDGGAWQAVGASASYTRTIWKFEDYQLRLRLTGTSFGENAPVLPPTEITVSCGGC